MTVIKEVRVFKNGFQIMRGMRWPTLKPEAPRERKIFEMSRKSKSRLAHIAANSDVKWKSLITLTYGDFFCAINGKELKRQLNIMLKFLRQRYDMEYLWFMEFTKKGKPHFHILTTITPNVIDRFWLAERWSKVSVIDIAKGLKEEAIKGDIRLLYPIPEEIIEEEHRKVIAVHRHKKTWDTLKKVDGATRYILKYAAKANQKLVPVQFGNCGRFWGRSTGVEVSLKGRLVVGEDISPEEVEEFFQTLLPNDLPLLPQFLFIPNAVEKLTGSGFTLRQLNTQDIDAKYCETLADVVD
jgi:hypothetical protein